MSDDQSSGRLQSDGYPYEYLQDKLEITVELCDVDGEGYDSDAVSHIEPDRRFDVMGLGDWHQLTLRGEIKLPRGSVSGTLPDTERDEPPVNVVLAVRSAETILRYREATPDDVQDAIPNGSVTVQTTLQKEELRGDVEIKPYLVRTSFQDFSDDYAQPYGARLASAEAYTIRVDQPKDEGGFLHPQMEAFSDRQEFPDDESLHYLWFRDPATPRLFLNSDHGRLVDVLFNEGSTYGDARLRDMLFDYIEQSVWQQLLLRTASDADPETNEVSHPWQEEVIGLFEDELFGDAEYEEIISEMGQYASSGDDLDVLAREFEQAIQTRIDHPTQARKLLEEALN